MLPQAQRHTTRFSRVSPCKRIHGNTQMQCIQLWPECQSGVEKFRHHMYLIQLIRVCKRRAYCSSSYVAVSLRGMSFQISVIGFHDKSASFLEGILQNQTDIVIPTSLRLRSIASEGAAIGYQSCLTVLIIRLTSECTLTAVPAIGL